MPWFMRLSRFGDVHGVYTQQGDNACGIASVMMCVFKVNKITPDAAAITKEQEVYKTYSDCAGLVYDGTAYSRASILDDTLNRLNCGSWKAENIGADKVNAFLIDHCATGLGPTLACKPVIVLIGWDTSGAHFVVVDTVRSLFGYNWASVCDPWDGQLRITTIQAGQTFGYETNQTVNWNLEGTPEHEYGSRDSGVANGWVVYQS